jgi:hypothetical protein
VGSKPDERKARYWQNMIHEAAGSGLSTREFCRRRKLQEGQFYWWQRKLAATRAAPKQKPAGARASFALVSDQSDAAEGGIELVLAGGRRLRIAKGVDEATLRSVLAALEQPGC